MPLTTTNPTTGQELDTRLEPHGPAEVEMRLARAAEAFERLLDGSLSTGSALLDQPPDTFRGVRTLDQKLRHFA